MRRPYIGMTDVPNAGWLTQMLRAYREAGGARSGRLLHAGVMMSYKTLNFIETSWAAVWPQLEEVAAIFVQDDRLLNTLHYADYEGCEVAKSLDLAARFGGPNLDAIQLDMIWPSAEDVAAFAKLHPNLRVILQIGANALARIDDDAETLIERLKPYEGLVHDVLLDKSGGKGLDMDAARLEPFIYELRARRPDLGITLAGGLGPKTLALVEPLVRKFPGLSIDAQGKLRPSGSNRDPIDADCAETYLRKAIAMFRSA